MWEPVLGIGSTDRLIEDAEFGGETIVINKGEWEIIRDR